MFVVETAVPGFRLAGGVPSSSVPLDTLRFGRKKPSPQRRKKDEKQGRKDFKGFSFASFLFLCAFAVTAFSNALKPPQRG
nr:hypothetical protein [Panacagrimonas sp.]